MSLKEVRNSALELLFKTSKGEPMGQNPHYEF